MASQNKFILKIGSKVRAIRKAKKLSQEKLADLMNCNFKTISNIENDNCVPDLKQIINLADILDISLDSLFSDVLRKTDDYIEPEEGEEGYPVFVNRIIVDPNYSKKELQQVVNIVTKIKNMTPGELSLVESLVNYIDSNKNK